MEDVSRLKEWTFGKRGLVRLEMSDHKGVFEISCCTPCCLYQALMPSLLNDGIVDNLCIAEPLTIWRPVISEHYFTKNVLDSSPCALDIINSGIKETLESLIKTFSDVSKLVTDPTILSFMLPLGTYIDFRLRVEPLGAISIMRNIQTIDVDGIHEFQWCLASALAEVVSSLPEEDLKKRLPQR